MTEGASSAQRAGTRPLPFEEELNNAGGPSEEVSGRMTGYSECMVRRRVASEK